MAFCWVFLYVCLCVCLFVYCVQYNGWLGNLLKPYKHLVLVGVYYCLKLAVNDLCIKYSNKCILFRNSVFQAQTTLLKICLLVQQIMACRSSSLSEFTSKVALREYLHSNRMSEYALNEWYRKLDIHIWQQRPRLDTETGYSSIISMTTEQDLIVIAALLSLDLSNKSKMLKTVMVNNF